MLEINNDENEKPIENSTIEEDMAAVEAVLQEAEAVVVIQDSTDDAMEIYEAAEIEPPPPEENLATVNQTTENQATEDQTTDIQTTKIQTTEIQTTDIQTTEIQTTEIQTTEIQTSEIQATENQATEENQTTENQASEYQPPANEASENNDHNNEFSTLNPLNEPESNTDAEAKTKNRRYWTPREEEKFYEIWGRENWRLTRHGKNTIFFAKWADEMREANFDIKPEEVQCKVNQTRAKFRQVKKHIETDKNYVKWKKYDIVEKILKNQYRSKDDEPVPLEAMENNRDVSPTEMLNCNTQPCSPNSISNMSTIPEQGINLSQSGSGDLHLTDEINMSNVSLSDQSLNLISNNSQSGTNFSTELFGSDQLEIKEEIEGDIKREGFINDLTEGGTIDGIQSEFTENQSQSQSQLHQHLTQALTLPQQQVPLSGDITTNIEQNQILIPNPNPNSLLLNNRLIQNHSIIATSNADGIININNLNNNSTMQPPKSVMTTPSPRKRNRASSVSAAAAIASDLLESQFLEEDANINNNNTMKPLKSMMIRPSPRRRNRAPSVSSAAAIASESLESQLLEEDSNINNNSMQPPKTMTITPAPRKRNRTPSVSSAAAIASESLESQYLEEVRKKNVLLVEQGEINRKRLRLEEKKVKLMEDFFPKFMNLQQEILQKLDTVTNSTPEAIITKIED